MVVLRAVSLFSLLAAATATVTVRDADSRGNVCLAISKAISSASSVYYPGSTQYDSDNFHTYGTSSQPSTCSVEPGSAEDVAKILVIVGATRTPFAVKSGGHAYNSNFSSTTGVLIAMARFNETIYDAASKTATVGSGLKWDAVYNALANYSVNVVGGRIQGVGVAGFTLGGGYSWLTNQYGLSVDNVVSFELVLPIGKIVTVSETSYPDLFFALRGGYNNFGIVTRFTLKTYPQGKVWGGIVYNAGEYVNNATAAALQFLKNNDPKASLLMTYGYFSGSLATFSLLFYDGPTPPAGIFDGFLTIPAIVNSVASQSFTSLIAGMPAVAVPRAIHNTIPSLVYDAAYLAAMLNETQFWGPRLTELDPTIQLTYTIEPFLPSFLSHGRVASAYPPSRKLALLPTTFDYTYTPASADAGCLAAMIASTAQLQQPAVSGVNISDPDVVRYGNYALAPETPVEDIFGTSLPRLRVLNKLYDPFGVMALSGGWKV